jgi:hypothetical protein
MTRFRVSVQVVTSKEGLCTTIPCACVLAAPPRGLENTGESGQAGSRWAELDPRALSAE